MKRVFLFSLLIFLSLPVLAAGPHGTQFGQPLNDAGQVVLTDAVADALASTGVGVVRVNFRLGSYTSDTAAWYAAYDSIVNRLRSRGIEVIALMTNEAWPGGSDQWKANAYETTGGNGMNPYLENWCNLFSRAATHWQGKVKYWELWNEPDCLAVIYPSNYGALLAKCYDLAHTNNIPVEIISGGICGPADWCPDCGPNFITKTYDVSINKTGWFTQMKNKWGTYPIDHIGFHIYPSCNTALNTSWLSSYMDSIYNSYKAYEGTATQKKVFLTEIGWMTDGGGCKTTEATQASNITALFNLANMKPYVKHVNYFFLQDAPIAGLMFGVYKSTGFTDADKKPSWNNLKTALTFEGRWSAGGTINQPILDYFNAKGHAAMGNPYNNGGSAWVHNWDFGPVQDYDGGELGQMVVCDSADGTAYAVKGNFLPVILQQHTNLEFPLGEQFFTGSVDKQRFDGGYATWTQAGGAQVTLYENKLALDNSDSGFTAGTDWTSKTSADGYKGNYRSHYGTATNASPVRWTLSVPKQGYYNVYVRYPVVSGAASAASYTVTHASGTAVVTLNQQSRGARWNLLGCYQFNTANGARIELSSQGSSSELVLADAVRIVGPVEGPDITAPVTPVVTDEGAYQSSRTYIRASWSSSDPESGIDHYEYAVGTSPTDPGGGYTVGWTLAGLETSVAKGAALTQGLTYYVYVRAYNTLGLVSTGVSDGLTVDSSYPPKPAVSDDGSYTGNPARLHCSWTASDLESGISVIEYALGTTAGGADVVPATTIGPVSQVWLDGLSLIGGKKYYFRIRAKNGAGLWSAANNSDGITYQAAIDTTAISDALGLPDSSIVLLRDKVITGLFLDRFYIQERDYSHGLAVIWASGLPEGTSVDITGALQMSNGERAIIPGSVTPNP